MADGCLIRHNPMPRDDCLRTRDVLVRRNATTVVLSNASPLRSSKTMLAAVVMFIERFFLLLVGFMLREIRRRHRHWKLTGDLLCIF
jgi:hypothetical protein